MKENLESRINSDNLTNLNLTKMVDFHAYISSMDGALTMGLMQAPDPRARGIATLDARSRIVDFVEKPKHPQGDLANCGVYIAGQSFFDCDPPELNDPGRI